MAGRMCALTTRMKADSHAGCRPFQSFAIIRFGICHQASTPGRYSLSSRFDLQIKVYVLGLTPIYCDGKTSS
jgi:hypothetical protein